MVSLRVDSLDALYQVVDHLDFFSEGDELRFDARLSQSISKAYNAYHKAIGGRANARLAVGASLAALGVGPVGWLVSGGAVAGLFAASTQLRELKSAYRALPCAAEVEDLARAGFTMVQNDGETVLLVKQAG